METLKEKVAKKLKIKVEDVTPDHMNIYMAMKFADFLELDKKKIKKNIKKII